MTRSFPLLFACISLLLIPRGLAQQPHAALQSQDAFLAEIGNKTWECSFTAYPRVRFSADKIEVLALNGEVVNTLSSITHPEPGMIRAGFNSGLVMFVFSDDLQSFVVANMKDSSEFTVSGVSAPAKLPSAAGGQPLEITFKDNPFWKNARVHADKMEVLDESGAVFATNEGLPFYPHAQGVYLPQKNTGLVALSRKQPGGWYLSGLHLGTGVRTERFGYFRVFLASKMTSFALRSAHFGYALLCAGLDDLATAQEQYGIKFAIDTYGETSDTVSRAYNEIGKLRGFARSYKQAPSWHLKAVEHAKANHSSDQALLLDLSIDLAESRNDAGDFAAAKAVLAEVYPLVSSGNNDAASRTAFQNALSATEFGLRNYAQAEKYFTENATREKEAKRPVSHVDALLDIIACQLAQNQQAKAAATLQTAMETQDRYIKEYPNFNFDTWKLAFACVALGKSEEALKYSPTSSGRGYIAYEEYGRLVALLHKGDRDAAQKFAKTLIGRFRDLDEVRIRRDVDVMTIQLAKAIAELTPASTTALEQQWAAQVESLRDRPLKNYIFARVVVATIANLKSGK